MAGIDLEVNGVLRTVDVEGDQASLYVLTEHWKESRWLD